MVGTASMDCHGVMPLFKAILAGRAQRRERPRFAATVCRACPARPAGLKSLSA